MKENGWRAKDQQGPQVVPVGRRDARDHLGPRRQKRPDARRSRDKPAVFKPGDNKPGERRKDREQKEPRIVSTLMVPYTIGAKTEEPDAGERQEVC